MNARRIILTVFVLLAIGASGLRAQEPSWRRYSIGTQFHYGSFLTTEPKAQYLRDSYTYFGELTVRRQERQTSTYHQNWGAGVFFGHTGSHQYIGSMGGVFVFTQFPLWTRNNFRSMVRTSAGIGCVEKPYNPTTNHKNVLIGSWLNAYLHLAWLNEVRLSPDLFVIAGLSFSHLSNGGSTLPNLGLNIPAVTMGVRYSPKEAPGTERVATPPPAEKVTLSFNTSAGIKQHPWIGSKRYLINVLQAEIQKCNKYPNEFGGGLILFYNRSLEVDPTSITSNKREGNKLQAGVYMVYERHLGRLSVPLQLGAYVLNQDIYPLLFQQLGFRYEVSHHWSAQLFLKTHTGKADFVHAGLGYRFK